MTALLCNPGTILEAGPGGLQELVRGREGELLERLTPLVRDQDVALDLGGVERIDAAGISALIVLYGTARSEGHRFGVVNVPARICTILKMVGLDRILVRQDAAGVGSQPGCLSRPAA